MERGQRLSDRFLLGEELGRGAFGLVYKGIDSTTGSSVAIKQLSLNGTSADNLQSVMGEIELLRTLNHKNIVKYHGSFKTRTHLYIILEFMESGSLSSIIKQCGVLSEELAAVYVAQVLQGLQVTRGEPHAHASCLMRQSDDSRSTCTSKASCTATSRARIYSRPKT